MKNKILSWKKSTGTAESVDRETHKPTWKIPAVKTAAAGITAAALIAVWKAKPQIVLEPLLRGLEALHPEMLSCARMLYPYIPCIILAVAAASATYTFKKALTREYRTLPEEVVLIKKGVKKKETRYPAKNIVKIYLRRRTILQRLAGAGTIAVKFRGSHSKIVFLDSDNFKEIKRAVQEKSIGEQEALIPKEAAKAVADKAALLHGSVEAQGVCVRCGFPIPQPAEKCPNCGIKLEKSSAEPQKEGGEKNEGTVR